MCLLVNGIEENEMKNFEGF